MLVATSVGSGLAVVVTMPQEETAVTDAMKRSLLDDILLWILSRRQGQELKEDYR